MHALVIEIILHLLFTVTTLHAQVMAITMMILQLHALVPMITLQLHALVMIITLHALFIVITFIYQHALFIPCMH